MLNFTDDEDDEDDDQGEDHGVSILCSLALVSTDRDARSLCRYGLG